LKVEPRERNRAALTMDAKLSDACVKLSSLTIYNALLGHFRFLIEKFLSLLLPWVQRTFQSRLSFVRLFKDCLSWIVDAMYCIMYLIHGLKVPSSDLFARSFGEKNNKEMLLRP
jgi:hypothetical protein